MMNDNDEREIQGVIEAARNLRARTSAADGRCYIVEIDDCNALDSAIDALDCTCVKGCERLGDCDVHGLEMPF